MMRLTMLPPVKRCLGAVMTLGGLSTAHSGRAVRD